MVNTNDKLALLTAGLHILAREAGHDDLITYLEHPSQHSSVFIEEVQGHLKNIADVVGFHDKHTLLTQPGGESRTYSKGELDRMVAESVQRAVRDAQSGHEQTFTRTELDEAIAKSVAAAMAKFNAEKGGK
jgi:hypothetical protein